MEPTQIKKTKIRAYSPKQVVDKKRIIYPFTGAFEASFGHPERIAKWFITGPSFAGKSSFMFMLCHALCEHGIVDYNNYEEGDSQTVSDKIVRHGLLDKEGLFRILPKVPIADFKHRLERRKSANFAVIDSIQHGEIHKAEYLDLVDDLCTPRRGKSILFVSHWIKNDLTKFIKHDCDIKIEVIGFVAHVESRYGGGAPFLIWEQGARRHWGKRFRQVMANQYWPGMKK